MANVTTNSSSQEYTHPDYHTLFTYGMTPWFKPFTDFVKLYCLLSWRPISHPGHRESELKFHPPGDT